MRWPMRRGTTLLFGMIAALLAQQAAFWFWRPQLGNTAWALIQFASVHFLSGLTFTQVRRRRSAASIWSDSVSKLEQSSRSGALSLTQSSSGSQPRVR